MSPEYTAIRTSRDEFVANYPDALGKPVGTFGFPAFGSAPIPLAEKLGTPDFDELQMFWVLVEEDLYLAFAPKGEMVGYPPQHVRVRVTDFGSADPAPLRAHIETTRDADLFGGSLIAPLGPESEPND